jgi:DnaJ like chaperone protein
MSIWSDLSEYISTLVSGAYTSVVEGVRTFVSGDLETRRRVAFSVAIIALSAKMAKADGIVTPDEVTAFQEFFHVPEEELSNVSRLFNLAKQDVAGFDTYARQVRRLFPGDDPSDDDILRDVLDALFHVAKADGVVHENESLFLEEIAILFGFSEQEFERLQLRHVTPEGENPYAVLEADPPWPFDKLKRHYRQRVMDSHPDRLIARGVPAEFVSIANDRVSALNAAWDVIEKSHRNIRDSGIVAAT